MPVAIITGASTGIGASVARELARRGWAVGLVARRAELLETLAGEIRVAGGKAAWVAADVTDRAAITSACARLEAELGPCDLMLANAGSGRPASAKQVPVEIIEETFQLNFYGVLYAAGAVLPGMLARKSGHIAVVSSIASVRGLPGHGAYSASKAAVSTLFESWRVDLRRTGIAVTSIHPGFIATPLTAKNKFKMPFLMTAEKAAAIMATGLEKRRSDITFPWQMAVVMYVARRLPNWLYDRIVGGSSF